MSLRTSGSQFSFSVSAAEVCLMKMCATPTRKAASSGTARIMSAVMRWQPRERGASRKDFCVHPATPMSVDTAAVMAVRVNGEGAEGMGDGGPEAGDDRRQGCDASPRRRMPRLPANEEQVLRRNRVGGGWRRTAAAVVEGVNAMAWRWATGRAQARR